VNPLRTALSRERRSSSRRKGYHLSPASAPNRPAAPQPTSTAVPKPKQPAPSRPLARPVIPQAGSGQEKLKELSHPTEDPGQKVNKSDELLAEGRTKIEDLAENPGYILLQAVRYRKIEKVKRLLAEGAPVDYVRRFGRGWDRETPLLVAAAQGDLEMVSLLVQNKANIREVDGQSRTALHLAASSGHESVVSFLIDRGADINARNKSGSTPLKSAAFAGNEKMVSLLIKKGANVNEQSKWGIKPLAVAITEKHSKVIEILRKAGASE